PVTTAANTEEAILENFSASGAEVPPVLQESLKLGVALYKTYTLYTTPPFENAYAARGVANKSMEQKAMADRVTVQGYL
ncbi:MAG: hypothetical protein RRY64_09240, partial [Oscillospiraceae bacterium]